MTPEHLRKHSKHLSWLLRHGAREEGLDMDPAGWAEIEDVLALTRMSRSTLDAVVRENDKSRLQVEGPRIRACQGHSLDGCPVTVEALEASWREWTGAESLWHGTSVEALPGIAREGLLPQARTHVHLAEATNSRIGKRDNVSLLLEISPERLRAAGLRLYESPNGVLLVRGVPVSAIVALHPRSKRAKQQQGHLRALLGLAA